MPPSAKPKPLKRAPKAAAAAGADSGGGTPSPARPMKKAKAGKKAAVASPGATATTPPTIPRATTGAPDLVQKGWVSMHGAGVPFVMWK